jgi:hypothetical protein
MALVACLECSREISDKAAVCPHCGIPITQAVVPYLAHTTIPAQPIEVTTALDDAVTTESTGKSWKAVQLVGVVLMVFGFAGCLSGSNPFVGVGLSGVGAVVTILGKLGAWWHHG